MTGQVETSDLVIVPVDLYVTVRRGGVYHGGLDWPEGKPRQEPDTFERIPVTHLVYWKPDRYQGRVEPTWYIGTDGVWRPFDPMGDNRNHWVFDVGPHDYVRDPGGA